MKRNNKVAIYIRVAHEDKAKVKEQKIRLKEYCKEKNYSIYNIYIDNGFSGRRTDRPAFRKMLGDFWDKKFNKVIVYDLSRLSRDISELSWFINLFGNKGVELESVKENLCTLSSSGKMFSRTLSLISEIGGSNAF
ncbi:MAG: recombinase family protein [Bacilli bacterium]